VRACRTACLKPPARGLAKVGAASAAHTAAAHQGCEPAAPQQQRMQPLPAPASADAAPGAEREPSGACAAAQSCPSMAGRAARAAAAAARLTALATAALADLPSSRRLAGIAAAVHTDARRQARRCISSTS